MKETRKVLYAVAQDIRARWKPLALTDIAYKMISFVLLAPLVGFMFRILLATSGEAVLADQDILFFLFRPAGWICFVIAGGLWLGLIALELSALMCILCPTGRRPRPGVVAALRFASKNVWRILRVTARLAAFTLLAIAPFALVAGITYSQLLTDHDINYYLNVKPPAFRLALGIGAALIISLVMLLLRLHSGWFYALPLVLFENVAPRDALRVSRQRAHGHRRTILSVIVGWTIAGFVISALATAPIIGLGQFLVPRATGALSLVAGVVGLTLILSSAVGLAVNLLTTTSFASLLFRLYRIHGGRTTVNVSATDVAGLESVPAGQRFAWTQSRLAAIGVVATVLAVLVGALMINTIQIEDKVQITAHRGSSAEAPENTMASVLLAIEHGADWVEIDVQETADGEVVVFHDSDFKKTADVDLKIWDATAGDLQDIDIGSWFAPAFKDQRVPTLAEVLRACRGKVRVNIELKSYGHGQQLERRVADIVEAENMAADIVIMSLKVAAVRKMKAIRPDWKVGQLMSVMAGKFAELEADFLAVNASFASPGFVRSAHRHNKEVHVWTVNDAASMSMMIGRGVDNIITDKPDLVRSVLLQRADMSPVERLMLELAGLLGVEPQVAEQ